MASISTHQINVSDMKCNGCEDTIQDELRHKPGVKRVSANYIEGTVEVEGDDDLDVDALVDEINELGFSANR
ncbi:heavy-metal-associated domain-containing protein [Halorientalis brevis]|uniref:Heavy-metal-associated domain-containing protein n=1 Tax=Halorientalis brevis TaxID=1126241 RepID=A0ABD6C7A2_9EURY|nr:heavy metal-associated domain-containing protein [Halorientalis brevis]